MIRPDDPGLADAAAVWRSAYVHVPFCRRRCPYCDFAVVVGEPASTVERYAEAVCREIAMEPSWGPLDAVNFGGGTPSTLGADRLAAILATLDAVHGVSSDAEISLEANPEDWSGDYGDALRTVGFNRVSFGVQSFDPAVLASLGRLHSPEQADAAVAAAVAAGFATVNIDLIYGSPEETTASWAASVDRALASGANHLSAYALTVEAGTELARAVIAGAPAPDPDVQADRYEALQAAAAGSGLVRYEVSNWAAAGHACRYNLATWAQGEYLGFGLGAHDHRDGRRGRNHRRLDRYLGAVAAGDRPRLGEERRDPWEREQERLMLGLRRVAGAVAGPGGEALLRSEAGKRLVDAGILAVSGDRLVVVEPLLTDEASRAAVSVSRGDW